MPFGSGVVIAAVVAAIVAIIGVQIFVSVNKSIGTAQTSLLDLVPLLLAALVIIGIVVYFGVIAGGRE